LSWVPDELDPESDQIREVYAIAGLALYCAQVLEHGLANLVVVAQIGSEIRSLEAMDERWSELFGLTMGRQLQEVLRIAEFSTDEIEQLSQALQSRNFLAHDFFRERAEDLLSFAGRNRMLNELRELRRQFEDADALLEPRVDKVATRLGITREVRKKEVEKTLREHRDPPSH
jgi:hypothetical protein